MSQIKKNGVRVIRKSAHLTHKVLRKGANFSAKVEDKTTRIITGKDFSVKISPSLNVEKVLFNGIKYNLSPLNPALPAVGRPPKITLLIPSLNNQSFFGGTATALIVAAKISKSVDMPLRIIETLSPGGIAGLGDFLHENGLDLKYNVELIDVSSRTYNKYGYIDLHPEDILIASAWWDAKLISQLPRKKPFIYLIQDYEPIFYANSDEYVLAENTYQTEDFIPLCNTKLMYDFMTKKGYGFIEKTGLWFEPAVSKLKYGNSLQNVSKRRIFLYGRPSVHRNLFYTAVEAINRAFSSGQLDTNGWEVYMAGQDKLPSISLSTGVEIQNLGKLTIGEYNEFIKTVDVAISPMMAPHPNYPTLEFASVGSMVVTTKYETKNDLSSYSKNILLADLGADSLTKAIVAASKIDYKQRISNLASNKILADWGDALDDVIDNVIERLETSS